MKRCLLLIFFFCFASATSLAQSTFGVNASPSWAVGNLAEETPGLSGSFFHLEFMLQIKESPFHIGGGIGWGFLGKDDEYAFEPGLGELFIREYNHTRHLTITFRYKPKVDWPVQPYADVFTGLNRMVGITDLAVMEDEEASLISSTKGLKDNSIGLGLGAGVEVVVGKSMIVDLGISSTQGSRVNYLAPRALVIANENAIPNDNIRNSELDFMSLSLRIKFLMSSWH